MFCGAAATQSGDTTQASPGLSLLSWEIQDVRDAMTDKLTRMAVSKTNFSNGTTLEASAKCDEIGIEFAFGTFSNKDPLPLSASGKEIQLRVRTDNGDTRLVQADRQYTNQAKTLFYDPDRSRAVLARSVRAPGGDSPMEKALSGWMANSTINEAMAKLTQDALGTTAALANAESVRIELTLADGRTDVFDLNPQDQALKTLVQQCASGPHTDRQAGGPLMPSLPFAQPKDVTLVHPTQVYLSANDSRGITAKGKLTILGQSQFTNGYYCIVRVQIDNQYKTGLIGIDILGAALDPSQAKACYMPYGTPGGVDLSAND